jgi:hypothetical protein
MVHARVTSGINDLLKKTHEILDKTTDPKMQLQTISVLTGLYSNIMSLATDASVIEQSLKRLEVWRDKNEVVFSAEDVNVNEGNNNGNCCFNHIIGLPQKNGIPQPLWSYEEMLYQALMFSGYLNSSPSTLPTVYSVIEKRKR